MKNVTIILLLLIIATSTFSQQTNPAPALTKEAYLKKSKTQKTVAWVLVSTGFLSTMLSAVRTPSIDGGSDQMSSAQTVLLITGLAEIGASIPLFIAGARNKKKAMSMSFRNEKIPQLQKNNFVYKPIPSLSLKISL